MKKAQAGSRVGGGVGGRAERLTKRGRESCGLWMSFKSLVWGHSFSLPLANHLALSGFEPTSGPTHSSPCVHVHLLAKMDATARVSGKVTGCTMVWSPSLL